jgi:tyrosine-protein phosphatase SIW14
MLAKTLKFFYDSSMALSIGSVKILIFYIRQHIFGNSIPNFTSVKESTLYRGGQPSLKGLEELMKEGIGVVVNLRARNRDKKAILKFTKEKMHSIHLPIFPFYPTEDSVVHFLKIFKKVQCPVYVHCFHGTDRTGLMCAMYRIVFEGWKKSDAIVEMKSKGFHFWQRSILSFIENANIEELKRKVFAVAD